MAATAKGYTLNHGTTYARQKGGIWQEAGLSALVRGLSETDNERLITAVTTAGILPGDASSTFPGLYCDEISPRVVANGNVQIDYVFRRKSGNSLLYLGDFTGGLGYHNNGANFIWEGSTSLSQIESVVDAFGEKMLLQHTYSAEDTTPPVPVGETDYQPLTLNVGSPQSTVTGRGYLQVAYPDVVSRAFTGYLNSDIWAGEPPGTWMCVNVDWQPVYTNTSPYIFEFSFTFQHDWRGHQPGGVYINPNTGKPPKTIVQGPGYRTFIWYPSREFYPFFPI